MRRMTYTTLFAILAAVTVGVVFINRSARRREAERAEEYRKAAALRGWEMHFDGLHYRYRGATEGVPWVCTVTEPRRRFGHEPERRPLRWETDAVRLEQGALVIWPDFGQGMDALKTPGVPQFVLNLVLRPVAWALGADGNDAGLLAGATEFVEGPPGYLFRAHDGERMRRWLRDGAARALEAEASWLANREQSHHLVVAVLWHRGLQIATPYGSNDLEQIGRVARVGARLANAARTESTEAVFLPA